MWLLIFNEAKNKILWSHLYYLALNNKLLAIFKIFELVLEFEKTHESILCCRAKEQADYIIIMTQFLGPSSTGLIPKYYRKWAFNHYFIILITNWLIIISLMQFTTGYKPLQLHATLFNLRIKPRASWYATALPQLVCAKNWILPSITTRIKTLPLPILGQEALKRQQCHYVLRAAQAPGVIRRLVSAGESFALFFHYTKKSASNY